jgi:hypothetical protein
MRNRERRNKYDDEEKKNHCCIAHALHPSVLFKSTANPLYYSLSLISQIISVMGWGTQRAKLPTFAKGKVLAQEH